MTGKGLEALIPKRGKGKASEGGGGRASSASAREGVFFVEIGSVVIGSEQPRKTFPQGALAELAASIRQHGILQPLVAEKHELETERGVDVRYHLLAGERRLRAAKMAGLKQVPVVVRQRSDDRTRLLLSLIENVQREDLNAMERAEAFARLRDDFGLSQEEIGGRIGKSREAVANTLRLLQLGSAAQEAVRGGAISEGHARALLSVPEEKREALLMQWKNAPVSVREAEQTARTFSGALRLGSGQVPRRAADPRRANDEERLRGALGVSVRITTRGERGSIALLFRSKTEFAQILKKLLRR